MEEEKKTNFTVSDKRSFSDERTSKTEHKKEETKKLHEAPHEAPEINFSTFVFSLSTSALIYLGEMDNPVTQKKEEDYNLEKKNIDILSILEEKTKGNLDPNEAKLLESLLYDLRMKYIEKVKGHS